MWGLFRTRCGCERLFAIPNPPPQSYVLPLRKTLVHHFVADTSHEEFAKVEERRFSRHGFTSDGYALYLEVE
jgi:hypothetical protein